MLIGQCDNLLKLWFVALFFEMVGFGEVDAFDNGQDMVVVDVVFVVMGAF